MSSISADVVGATGGQAGPGWLRLWWDTHFTGFSRREAWGYGCRVPKPCSRRGIIPICRQKRVLTPHTDDAEKLRG